VAAWEQQLRLKRTPLDIYYASWLKTHEIKKRRQAAQTDEINADYDVPKLKKLPPKSGVPVRNENGEVELFPSDSEDEGDDGLHVGSDDEDDEVEEEEVEVEVEHQWEQQLGQANVSIDIVRKVIQAFNSALASISADGADGGENQPNAAAFKVVGAAAFNGVIQLCVIHLQPAIIKLLGVKPNSSLPLHKHKKWVKVRGCLRYYLTDLIRLVEQVSSPNILGVLLKHLHQMAGMVVPFSALGKTILKRLVVLWATGDETVRVLAFLCILKITRKQQVDSVASFVYPICLR